jgi:hypothetical protein
LWLKCQTQPVDILGCAPILLVINGWFEI